MGGSPRSLPSGRRCDVRARRTSRRLAPAWHSAVVAAVVAAIVLGAAAVPASAALPAPVNLRITPGLGSLELRWGVATTEGLGEFRVRWRPVSAVAQPWSPAVVLGPAKRRYTVTGLKAVPYEVLVRSLTTEGTLAGAVKGVGTPLAD